MSKEIKELNHFDMVCAAQNIALQIEEDFKNYKNLKGSKTLNLYGVPRGGIPCTYLVKGFIHNISTRFVDDISEADIIIDDIIDSGRTKEQLLKLQPNAKFYALFVNPEHWLSLPFERTLNREDTSIDDAVIRIMEYKNIDLANFESYKTKLLGD